MAGQHVVYRCELEHPRRWRGYVPSAQATDAMPVHVRAESLGAAQRLMAASLLGTGQSEWVQHTEHSTGDGLWVREALDEQVLEREHTTRVLMQALRDQRLRARLTKLPACRAGGVPVVTSAPGDTMSWILDQHDGHGALVVAAAVTNHRLWWNTLIPADRAAETDLAVAGGLAELGLTDPHATLDDWMATTDCGCLVLLAPRHAATPRAGSAPFRPHHGTGIPEQQGPAPLRSTAHPR